MKTGLRIVAVVASVFVASRALADPPVSSDKADTPATVRCAVIGGMMDTGFWDAVAERFTAATGHRVQVVAHGPKHMIAPAFMDEEADLITMHASDTIINLVADGYGENPQPWAKNDLLLIGPPSDPAGVRGMTDIVEALAKIIETKQKLLVHSSLGAQEVLVDLLADGGLELDPEHTVMLPGDKHRQLINRAMDLKAYTLVGRIPFRNGKIPAGDLVTMVEGDPRMRRPYLVVVARSFENNAPRHAAAVKLAQFLRLPETQEWIADFGRGVLDDRPLFFSVVVDDPTESTQADSTSASK